MTDNKLVQSEPVKLNLAEMQEVDLTVLDENQQSHIIQKYNEAQVDLAKTAQQAKIDIQATKAALDGMTNTIKNASDGGTSITITHTQDTSIGRTEIVMGNTDRAARGKISRSGAGLTDNSLKITVVLCVTAIFISLTVFL